MNVTIDLDQLDAVHETLVAKYRELWEEGESAGKRKRRGEIGREGSWPSRFSWKKKSKRMDFKF